MHPDAHKLVSVAEIICRAIPAQRQSNRKCQAICVCHQALLDARWYPKSLLDYVTLGIGIAEISEPHVGTVGK
ncbi:hypothetical protein GCM10010862_34040 [Devosia nitrariae]|uniref:Uncharacterized protein n=1 Tax=Devosia nitrariae TaxID=2071872 RepID=A0ABQ5W879_9HYPH|nr:hypothetical protein GCM10010862_34040 [Devosia nitrariae]